MRCRCLCHNHCYIEYAIRKVREATQEPLAKSGCSCQFDSGSEESLSDNSVKERESILEMECAPECAQSEDFPCEHTLGTDSINALSLMFNDNDESFLVDRDPINSFA